MLGKARKVGHRTVKDPTELRDGVDGDRAVADEDRLFYNGKVDGIHGSSHRCDHISRKLTDESEEGTKRSVLFKYFFIVAVKTVKGFDLAVLHIGQAHFLGVLIQIEGAAYVMLAAVDGLLIRHVAVVYCQLFFAKQSEKDGKCCEEDQIPVDGDQEDSVCQYHDDYFHQIA